MPLLADPSEDIRLVASYALRQFERLEPRHLPALIAAHKRGLDVAEAIARTGSDEALRYLEAGWSAGDEPNQTRWALPLFGARAQPFLLRRLEECRRACSRDEAQSLIYALGRIGPLPDAAEAVIHDVAFAPSTEPKLRLEMEDELIKRRHPDALPILVRRLEAIRGIEGEDWLAVHLFEDLRGFDAAAGPSGGPLVLYYLSRPELRNARIAAVVASWIIEYRPAVPALRKLLAEADTDWRLAYNTVWALGELGGTEARPQIARLARRHWFLPVRNMARRALNRLDGDELELPELPGEQRGPYVSELRFAADVDAVRDCRFDRAGETLRFGRDAPIPVRWPRRGAVRIEIDPPPGRSPGPLGKGPHLPEYGTITLDWRRAGGRVVAVDGKHWHGGLFVEEPGGGLRRVLSGDTQAVLETPEGLLVFTGDSVHHSGDGDLWRVGKGGEFAVMDGPLRLPAVARGFAMLSDRILIVRTERGDVRIDRSGRFHPPRPCRDKRSPR